MSLVYNAMEKVQGKIAVGIILLAGMASMVTCTLLFFEEEVPQDIQANLSQFK